jgi:hypothetical protein
MLGRLGSAGNPESTLFRVFLTIFTPQTRVPAFQRADGHMAVHGRERGGDENTTNRSCRRCDGRLGVDIERGGRLAAVNDHARLRACGG